MREDFQRGPINRMAYVNNLRMFVRVYELGSMSAAERDQRTSPAVASARIADLEKHLGIRLFNRTTRTLQPTENGRLFYEGALKILDAIAEAEATVADAAENPRGTIFVAAPLGVGRRFIAPHVPVFKDRYPQIDVRLRLSDRGIDVAAEGLDVAFHLGTLEDSALKVRVIADCPRLLCAAPAYIAERGAPADGEALIRDFFFTPNLSSTAGRAATLLLAAVCPDLAQFDIVDSVVNGEIVPWGVVFDMTGIAALYVTVYLFVTHLLFCEKEL